MLSTRHSRVTIMKRHKKTELAAQSTAPDPVDAFLAQAPFVETDGVDDAAIERDRLANSGPDAEAISEKIRLTNLHHEQSR